MKISTISTATTTNITATPTPHVQRCAYKRSGSKNYSFFILKNGSSYYVYTFTQYLGPYSDVRLFTITNDTEYSSLQPVIAARSGTEFSFYLADTGYTITTQSISLTSGYSIEQWVFSATNDNNVLRFLVIYGAGNGTNHYYGAAQITESGVTSLFTTSTYAGSAVPIPAPCVRYPLDGWFTYFLLNENGTYKFYNARLATTPYYTSLGTVAFPSGYTVDVCSLNAFNDRYQITLKKSADSTYTQFIFTESTAPVAVYNGLIVWPQHEVLNAFGYVLTFDITNDLYVLLSKNYPGVHPFEEVANASDTIAGWHDNAFYDYYTSGSTNYLRKIIHTNENVAIQSGKLTDDTIEFTVATKIPLFRNKHVFLYNDSDTLLARALVLTERYENGLQTLYCKNLNAELLTLNEPAAYNSYNVNYIVRDQLKNALYLYPGTLQGGSLSLTIREGYSLQKTLEDLAVIVNGLGYITPSGSVEFRVTTFETGPTLSSSNANYVANSFSELKSNYGGVRVFGAFNEGQQYIAEKFDDRGDRSLIYETEYPTIYEEPTLDTIAENILDWQQSGIKSVRLAYFGYLPRGKKCSIDLSGFGVRFGQSETVNPWDGYVLNNTYDLRAEQSAVELCSVPAKYNREKIPTLIQQQIRNTTQTVLTYITLEPTNHSDWDFHCTSNSGGYFILEFDLIKRSFSVVGGGYSAATNNLSQNSALPSNVKAVCLYAVAIFNIYGGTNNIYTTFQFYHPDGGNGVSAYTIYHNGVAGYVTQLSIPALATKSGKFRLNLNNLAGQHFIGFKLKGYWV